MREREESRRPQDCFRFRTSLASRAPESSKRQKERSNDENVDGGGRERNERGSRRRFILPPRRVSFPSSAAKVEGKGFSTCSFSTAAESSHHTPATLRGDLTSSTPNSSSFGSALPDHLLSSLFLFSLPIPNIFFSTDDSLPVSRKHEGEPDTV